MAKSRYCDQNFTRPCETKRITITKEKTTARNTLNIEKKKKIVDIHLVCPVRPQKKTQLVAQYCLHQFDR